jgi:outer membrane protein assembly factor BamB
LSKRKVLSKQNVDSTCVLAKSTSAVAAVQIQKNQATIMQQGAKKQFQVSNGVVYLAAYKQAQNNIFIFKRNTAIYAYDQQGNKIWEKTLPLKELSQCQIYQQPSGQTCLAFLDAIGNQIYLLDDLGRNLDQQDRHGEEQVQVTSFGASAYSITTFLGTYLIQYTKQ